jgi:hypothetical protein
MSMPHFQRVRVAVVSASSVLLFASCVDALPPETFRPPDAAYSKGGGGKKGDVTVTAVDPSQGYQGDTDAEMLISGSGFSGEVDVAWERDGAPDPGITVHAATVVSSTSIVARITIANDAEVGYYDVAVTLHGSGKRGVGTELFQVNKQGSGQSDCGGRTDLVDSRIDLEWDAVQVSGVGGDGLGLYRGGEDGLNAKIFYHDPVCSQSSDAIFNTGGGRNDLRRLVYHFPAGNDAGLPSGGIRGATWLNFQGLMRIGSDLGADGVANSRDAKIEAKMPGSLRAVEFPSAVAFRPGYPDYASSGGTKFRLGSGVSLDIKGCEKLEYDLIRLERTGGFEAYQATGGSAGGVPLAQWSHEVTGGWVVESVAPHMAQCYHTVKGKLATNGSPMPMPFRVTITERRP